MMNESVDTNQLIQKKNNAVFLFIIANILVNICSWAVLIWKIPRTQDIVFLHYNIYFGIDLAGNWVRIFLLPSSGLVILCVNAVFVLWHKRMDYFVRIMMMIVTTCFELVIFSATILLILLNN
ncbi:MAG TPA: hypothetical protein VJB65_02260 [Patescibacteria group bacterium]|nr:hypothetical protein [Patescibacteria group bacterium]